MSDGMKEIGTTAMGDAIVENSVCSDVGCVPLATPSDAKILALF